ncbi:MAG: cyclic nucleotide-binding domain-containing protein [Desulfarculaceae bacterium]|nr:cyclic nucleotide-binding domain-containing protein [Desulfarculaceae bacterium]
MVSLDVLENLDIFEELTDEELSRVADLCSEQEYQREDRLFTEGEPAREMWIVTEGEVELRFEMPNAEPSTSRTAMSTHQKETPESQVFGWSCFIPPYKMRLSAFCMSRRCTVVKISASALNNLMDADNRIGYNLMKYMVQVVGFRFKQFQDEVAKFTGIGMLNTW